MPTAGLKTIRCTAISYGGISSADVRSQTGKVAGRAKLGHCVEKPFRVCLQTIGVELGNSFPNEIGAYHRLRYQAVYSFSGLQIEHL